MATTVVPSRKGASRKFVITGGNRLAGEYPVQGNKNAALPLICAALLARAPVLLRHVPRIDDVDNLLLLIQALGVEVEWQSEELLLDSSNLESNELPAQLVERLRGAVLLLAPLAAAFDPISCAIPGGCPIGRRSFDIHWRVFEAAGYTVDEGLGTIELKRTTQVREPRVYLEESSVTATENALLLFGALGAGTIENPAREPHVFSLIEFLNLMGCEIELHPLYFRIVRGVNQGRREIEFDVPPDYTDAGTIAIATAVTGGDVLIRGIRNQEMMGIQTVLRRFGIGLEFVTATDLKVGPSSLKNPSQVTAGPWPLFPTDLVSLAIVLATQTSGLCLIHDWMYEARMFFVDKLVRMGAHITMCDPHRVLVEGPSRLRGKRLESPDIRAGMALLVAGLCAEGETVIEHGEVVLRGYEKVTERLRNIGAQISEEQRQ